MWFKLILGRPPLLASIHLVEKALCTASSASSRSKYTHWQMQNTSKNLLKAQTPVNIQKREAVAMSGDKSKTPEEEFKITLTTPVEDYVRLIDTKVMMDEYVEDEVLHNNYNSIAAAARNTIWQLLFSETEKDETKAGELLKKYKPDACFHNPFDYNDWIKLVRDELLKREMLDFWRDQIVKHELGLCWAKDSDYFDDFTDSEPEEFYRHGGCVAPFKRESSHTPTPSPSHSPLYSPTMPDSAAEPVSVPLQTNNVTIAPLHISLNTPLADYKAILEEKLESDPDNQELRNNFFAETRDVVWELLFKDDKLEKENFDKAAALLMAYKSDACFHSPYDYNDWIIKLRDKLFERKYLEFWKTVIVDEQCGLCWYKDSDFFDDDEDKRPIEFYKSGDDLLKQSSASK